jgi:DNA modification methylase
MSSKPNTLAVEWAAIASIQPDPRNARQHSKAQIKQIARSIESFGYNVPILINADGLVVAGHGRLAACQLLGHDEVPVIRLGHLTAAQARAFAIADNRLTDTSSWNDRLLGEVLKELSEQDLDFSIEATGFSMGEIDLRIEGLDDQTQGPDSADNLTTASSGPAVTEPGDLWRLGEHRILCASALEPASLVELMGGQKAAMVFTDPPYNVKIDGHVSGKGKVRHREFAMAVGEMSAAQFTVFLSRSLAGATEHSCDGALHYVCIDWRHAGELLAAAEPIYADLKNVCVWVKDNGGMGSLYRSRHELVFVFKAGEGPYRNNVELGRHGRNRTNVWEYPGANTFNRNGSEGPLAALHPTVKPVALVADAILDASARRDIVLDLFLGSGSTLLAAERVGRVCYGLEIDPLYVDLAIRRWQLITGEDAIHEASGDTFTARTPEVADVA